MQIRCIVDKSLLQDVIPLIRVDGRFEILMPALNYLPPIIQQCYYSHLMNEVGRIICMTATKTNGFKMTYYTYVIILNSWPSSFSETLYSVIHYIIIYSYNNSLVNL